MDASLLGDEGARVLGDGEGEVVPGLLRHIEDPGHEGLEPAGQFAGRTWSVSSLGEEEGRDLATHIW